MTLGSRGCMLVSPEEPKPLHVEVPPALRGAKVVDTTGAGDGFLGALAHFVAAGRPLADALAGAVHVASLSVQKRALRARTRRPRCCRPSSAPRPPPRRRPPPRPPPPPSPQLQLHKRSSLLSAVQQQKRAAARHAVDAEVRSGMVVGICTGEAAGYALGLIQRLGSGELSGISCVPTSEKTEAEVRRLGVPCVSLDTQAAPAVAIGGADAVDGACNLIKGGKGALSREKLVQAEAARYVVVVDEPKLCARVGGAHPVPVEIPVFAQRTLRQIAALPALAPCDPPPLRRRARRPRRRHALPAEAVRHRQWELHCRFIPPGAARRRRRRRRRAEGDERGGRTRVVRGRAVDGGGGGERRMGAWIRSRASNEYGTALLTALRHNGFTVGDFALSLTSQY